MTTDADMSLPRAFLRLWGGQTASLFGTEVAGFGIAILVFLETGSLLWMTALFLAARGPGLLVSAHAGALVDRLPRRLVLLVADAAAGAASVAALLLHAAGELRPTHLAVLVAVGSLANAYQETAYEASLPALAGGDALPRAHGLVQLSPAVAMLGAPALGGFLVATFGLVGLLALDLVTFLIAVAVTATTPIPDPPPSPPETAAPTSSLRSTWAHLDGPLRGVRRLIAWSALLNIGTTTVNLLLPALLLTVTGPTTTGLIVGLGGLAMLVGGGAVSARGIPARRISALSTAIGVVGIGFVLVGLRPATLTIALGVVVALGAAPVVGATLGAVHQTAVDPSWHGRLAALRRVVGESLSIPTALVVAPLVERFAEPAMSDGGRLASSAGAILDTGAGRGMGLALVLAGLAIAAAAVVISRDRTIRQLDAAPAAVAPASV
ncbi:MAG: MFS transporter [Actinomycetota bacterium]